MEYYNNNQYQDANGEMNEDSEDSNDMDNEGSINGDSSQKDGEEFEEGRHNR
jgi:hypothetical protein